MHSAFFPVAEKPRISANMVGRWQRSSGSLPRMSSNGAPPWPSSGMRMCHLRMFSASKIPDLTYTGSPDTIRLQGIQKDPFGSCGMDALHEASKWSSFLHVDWIHEYCRTAGRVAVSVQFLHSELVSSMQVRYESDGLGFIDGNSNRLRKGPHNVLDMWSTYLEGERHIYCHENMRC